MLTKCICCSAKTRPISSYPKYFKPASNDFGCICEQSWKDQCSMEVYITINQTKSYCSKLLTKFVITTKNLFLHSLCYLMSCSHWLHVSKGQTILLQWCDLTSSGDGSTLSGDCSTNRTKSNTIKTMWYNIAFHPKLTTDTCTQYER